MTNRKRKSNDDAEPEKDAAQAMFDAAFRKQREIEAADAMEKARVSLVIGKEATHVFFSTLVMKLGHQVDWDIPNCTVNGRVIKYNPEFFMLKTRDQIKSAYCKAAMHCAFNHPGMKAALRHLDQDRLRLAMELVTNQVLKDAGFTLLPEAILPGKEPFKKIKPGLSTLETYREIPVSKKNPDLGGVGTGVDVEEAEGRDGGKASEADLEKLEQDWKINTAIAADAAQKRGNISANMATLINELLKHKVPWREVLRDWVSRKVKQEINWTRQNRRYIASGIYLPTLGGESINGLIIANDTSGSMSWQDARSACACEIQGIAEQMKCAITILHHDSAVCAVQQWTPEDGPLKLEPRGGGGTSHRCVTDWIERHIDELGEISGLICLTDMYTEFPREEPEYPVLWAVVGNKNAHAPFGTVLEIDAYE